MILLYFIEINILNDDNIISNPSHKSFNINIKKMIIAFGFTCIMYILLHQINQNNNGQFEFKTYNKMLIIFMLVDIVISLFFLSKFIIANLIDIVK
jgi:hypothetical protein